MQKETIEQSRIRIQGYIEKIHSLKKLVGETLIDLIDFLKKSHELRKDLADVFISVAEDTKNEINITAQIQSLLSEEDVSIEHDEEMRAVIVSLKEFSFSANLKKSEIDSELAEKIEKAIKDLDEAFHEELDPILDLITKEQHKIDQMQKES